MRYLILLVMAVANSACAYHWGFGERSVPGGYKQVAVPMFKNKSQQVGVEADFTNAIIRQFERSQVAQVTDKAVAPVRIDGVIEKIDVLPSAGGITGGPGSTIPLPVDAVLRTDYSLLVKLRIDVRRQSDEKIIWTGQFQDLAQYQAPRITETVVNSADATYNDSARRLSLAQLAEKMMSEAHDRITENF